MSASPLLELSSKTMPMSRDGTKNGSAERENFDQVLNQKLNSRAAPKPQSLPTTAKATQSSSTEVATESPPEVINETEAKVKVKKDFKVTDKKGSKEEIIKKFMDSFESEFQVPPTRLVEAMAQLTPEQLSDSAESTAELFIGQLNLDPNVQPKAKKQYLELVQDLNQMSVVNPQPTFLPEGGMLALGLTQQRFQNAKNNRAALHKSLDQMNLSFWQPKGFAKPIVDQPLSNLDYVKTESLLSADLPAPTRDMGVLGFDEELLALSPEEIIDHGGMADKKFFASVSEKEIDTPPSYEPSVTVREVNNKSQVVDPKVLMALGVDPESQQLTRRELVSQQAANSMASANLGTNANLKQNSNLSTRLNSEFSMPSMLNSAESLNSATPMVSPLDSKVTFSSKLEGQSKDSFFNDSAFAKEMTKGNKQSKSKGEDLKTLFAAQVGQEIAPLGTQKSEVANSVVPARDLTQTEVDKNIQNIMNQAQYLVKKGGGEIKVKMTPEGLGQIQLKVDFTDGKLQMQMLAENKETKKILESNLSELKDHLSSHKLSVESIKIDSVQSLSSDVATRNQNSSSDSSHQQNPSDRQTKQFWNQFQEQFGRGAQREALYESPKVKGYAQKKSNTIAPAEGSASVASAGSGKSRGLNLVA